MMLGGQPISGGASTRTHRRVRKAQGSSSAAYRSGVCLGGCHGLPLDLPHPLRQQVRCHAKKDGDKNKDAAGDAGKADFSAYWSLKVRQFFSSRNQYLEGGKKEADPRPAALQRLDEEIVKQQDKLSKLREEQIKSGIVEKQQKDADAQTARLLDPIETKLFGRILPPLPEPDERDRLRQEAKDELVGPGLSGVPVVLSRAQQLVQSLILAPWTLAVAAFKAWQGLWDSQRYEMFLMSEGERIWYWRNRTENERWFWEIFAWDRLLFPIICTVAYEYIVPNNLIWAVVVPSMFIMWQTGSLPKPQNMEFWLIAYFGVYKKCWGDVLGLAATLFRWA